MKRNIIDFTLFVGMLFVFLGVILLVMFALHREARAQTPQVSGVVTPVQYYGGRAYGGGHWQQQEAFRQLEQQRRYYRQYFHQYQQRHYYGMNRYQRHFQQGLPSPYANVPRYYGRPPMQYHGQMQPRFYPGQRCFSQWNGRNSYMDCR